MARSIRSGVKARHSIIVPIAALLCAACSSSSDTYDAPQPGPTDQPKTTLKDPYARSFLSSALARPILGTAGNFAILGGQSVTNTGPTTSDGSVGVWPGSSIVGTPDITVIDTTGAGNAVYAGTVEAKLAQDDVTIAYDALAGEASNFDLTGQDLGGMTLVQGVYTFSSEAQLTGSLVLDAQGDTTAIWIFQVATKLTTASASSVSVINGGQDCAVFWQVGTSATLGTGTSFKGSILALASISLTTGATMNGGRALARNGSVTLDTNYLSAAACTNVGPSQPCE